MVDGVKRSADALSSKVKAFPPPKAGILNRE